MSAAILLLFLIGAPGDSDGLVTLRYRFQKGLVYEDRTERSFYSKGTESDGKVRLWDMSSEETLRRTIVQVDETAHPTMERVEVLKFERTIRAMPNRRPGVIVDPAAGKTFLWRITKKGWRLYNKSERDVTEIYTRLVARLKNWRDARLPEKPIAVGGTWSVSYATFLRTSGSKVPDGVKGLARFKLESVQDGLGKIAFTIVGEESGNKHTIKGVWMFDVKNGRDISLENTGKVVSADGGKSAKGNVRSKRTVTYQ